MILLGCMEVRQDPVDLALLLKQTVRVRVVFDPLACIHLDRGAIVGSGVLEDPALVGTHARDEATALVHLHKVVLGASLECLD